VGQTFWAWEAEDGEAGMAWDWVELGRGLVAMADPLSVVTNLRLVTEGGEALNRGESMRHINGIVHQLPWQQEVGRALEQLAAEQPEVARSTQRLGGWQRQAH
jgi:hypothetical protein